MFRIYRNIGKECVPFAPLRCTSWFPKSVEIQLLSQQFWRFCVHKSSQMRLTSTYMIYALSFFSHSTWKVSKLSNRNVLAPSYYLWQHVKWEKGICKQEGEECGKILFLVLYWEVHNVFRERQNYRNFILGQISFFPFPNSGKIVLAILKRTE